MAQIIDVVMRLQDNVTKGLKSIREGMEQTARANRQMGAQLSNAGRNIGKVTDALMPLAAGITGIGAIGVKTFMDFDAVITGAGIKAGATAEEMQKMKEAAAQMGAKFPTTARDVAAGMDRLAAGGFNAEQAIGAMPGIIEASIASGEDLATTSDVITSALSIWGMATGDVAGNTTHMADVIQAAANASKLGMQDFGTAMQYAGAPAAALGISVEELGTAMGIMANNGIEASTIGTSLRSTLTRLAAPPKAAADAMAQLGISAANLKNGDGSFIGLAGAVDILRGKMAGLSSTEQVALAKAIAGEEAYSGLLALIRTSPDAYKKMSNAIKNSSGQSEAAYKKMQDTLKGSIDALMSSVEGLGISFGAALAPSIRSMAEGIKTITDALTNMSPEAKAMIINIGESVLAMTAFSFATSKALMIAGSMTRTYGMIGQVMKGQTISNKALQFGVQGVMKGFNLMRAVIPALLGPIGVALLAIAAGAYYIYSNWETIYPFFMGIWESIKGTFSSAMETLSPLVNSLTVAWTTLTNSFGSSTAAFSLVKGILSTLSMILKGQLYSAIVLISAVLTGTLTAAVRVVSAVVGTAIGVFTGLINFITGVFTGDWSLAWEGVVGVFGSVFGGISGIVDGILAGVKAAINAVIAGLNNISVDIPDWVPNYGGSKFGLNIPYLSHGTNNWGGGAAVINEKGGEIVDLPKGSRVIPHDESVRTAYNMGMRSQGGNDITVNIIGTTINNGQDIKELARQVAEQIHYEMEKEAINSAVGGIA